MGLFSRLGTLIRSNINELINKAEDPEKMLNQVLVDMKQQLIEAKKQVAVSIADEKRLAKQAEQEAANAAEWERRAMLAMAQIQFEAGAHKVLPVHELARPYTAWSEAKQAIESFPMKPLLTKVVSAHVMGGCAAAGSERQGVTRPDGLYFLGQH